MAMQRKPLARCTQPIGGLRPAIDKPRQDIGDVRELCYLPLRGDLSSNMRPKCISRIELGDVGLGSHSVPR